VSHGASWFQGISAQAAHRSLCQARSSVGFDAAAFLARRSRFPRLVKDYERLDETLAGLHLAAFSTLIRAWSGCCSMGFRNTH
jgi:hypothetical protein